MLKPLVIAIEGCNAAGKSHTIDKLKNVLEQSGLQVACFKAPDYNGLHGTAITDFLKGRALSGHLVYDQNAHKSIQDDQRQEAITNFKEADRLFKENRLSVQSQIQSLTTKDVILIDRWSLSAIVYSIMRFQDMRYDPGESYYAELVAGEIVPDMTILLQQEPSVIVERMQNRIAKWNAPCSDIPVVWLQNAACFQRTSYIFALISQNTNHVISMTNPTNEQLSLFYLHTLLELTLKKQPKQQQSPQALT